MDALNGRALLARAVRSLPERAREWVRSPTAWIVLAAVALRVVGLTWGLPASDGWDNDGVAPRDFLPGLIETFTPGHYFTYPPVHLALLAILTLPVSLLIVAHAPSLAPSDVVREAIAVPYMTAFAVAARIVGLIMSIGIIVGVAKIARVLAGRRAQPCAAAVCSVNVLLTYYGHTSNLDVPYVFWATLALLALTRALAEHQPRRLRAAALFAALSVATKDQAYALFVLSVPAVLCAWAAFDPWARAHLRAWIPEAARALGLGAGAVCVLDAIVVNPTGFAARVRYLTGPASQPFAHYSADAVGRALAVLDSLTGFDRYYPLALAPLVVAGIVRAVRLPERSRRIAACGPLAAIASFTLFFNCVARRTEDRFLLPQMTLWAVYGGLGIDALLSLRPRAARVALAGAAAMVLAWAAFRCADVDANLVLDPRYDAEAWLRARVAPGDTLEIYGKNVYLPRLPVDAAVARVGRDPLATRNPLPGVVEVQAPLGGVTARAPRWIVVAQGWAGHVLSDARTQPGAQGRVFAGTEIEDTADADAVGFLRGLFGDRLGYGLAHTSTWTSRFWPRLDIHGTVSQTIWIFERSRPNGPAAP